MTARPAGNPPDLHLEDRDRVPFPIVASGAMGTVEDWMLHVDERTRARLLAWMGDGGHSVAIKAFHVGTDETVIQDGPRGTLHVPGTPDRPAWGGNAHNTFRALHRVADAMGVSDSVTFVVDYAVGLDREMRATLGINGHETPGDPDLPGDPHVVLREPRSEVPVRRSLVVEGPNGDPPLYLKVQPQGLEAPPLPDAPEVFLSSYSCDQTGKDVWARIHEYHRRNPEGRVLLAPGSVQVLNGIPEEVYPEIHLLACNREEALQLLNHAGRKNERTENDPKALTRAFLDLGVREVRITDGGKGVYSMSAPTEEGGPATFYPTPIIPRDHPLILRLVRRHLLGARDLARLQQHPDFNGCGDARLGVELAARALSLFDDPRKAILYSALLATLQTYNPCPNIAAFSDQLIYETLSLTEQLWEEQKRSNPDLC